MYYSKTTLGLFRTTLAFLFLTTIFFSCVEEEKENLLVEKSIFEIISNDPQFSILVTLFEKIEMTELLKDKGSFTLLAPTDQAFESFFGINKITLEDFLNTKGLTDTIMYHLLPIKVTRPDLYNANFITQIKEKLYCRLANGDIFINGKAKLIEGNILANNGIIHSIDYLLIPPIFTFEQYLKRFSQAEEPEFTYLVEAMERTNYFEKIDGDYEFTLFAPTDYAFEQLFKEFNIKNLDEFEIKTGITLESFLASEIRSGRIFSESFARNTYTFDENNFYFQLNLLDILTKNGVIHGVNEIVFDFI